MQESETLPEQIPGFMERRSGWIILAIVAITVLQAVPMIAMAPDESASDNPGGRVAARAALAADSGDARACARRERRASPCGLGGGFGTPRRLFAEYPC